MKEKQFDPARENTEPPAPGMAAVNTHNPDSHSAKLDATDKREPGEQAAEKSVKDGSRDEGPE